MQNNEKAALIPIRKDEKIGRFVFARELYDFLEVKTRFDKWIVRMFEYGFVENQDYSEVTVKNDHNSNGGKSTLIDYIITTDAAKEISMLQRTEKGKQARLYFIACEKALTNQKFDAEKAYLLKIDRLHQKIDGLKAQIKAMEKFNQQNTNRLKEEILSLEKSNEDNKFYANLWGNATAEMVKLCQKIADRKAKVV